MARGVQEVARRFSRGTSALAVTPEPGGHIHDTWYVSGDGCGDLVLQRLNERVFPDCVQMMDNVLRLVVHLQRRAARGGLADPQRRVLTVVCADGGELLVYDDDGAPWRACRRVDRASVRPVLSRPDEAYEIGRALGRFLVEVQSLPGPPLPEPIPGFKDFGRRREDFEIVVDVDAYDRVSTSRREINDVRSSHRLVDQLSRAVRAGFLVERTVHNDAKASNVLLDDATGEALCVIDLDTVARGFVLYDVGDLLRSSTVTSAEDATDPTAIAVRDDLLEAALSGYLAEAAPVLTADELSLLPLAGPLMAYENALRFLTDHLAGDVYFRIDRPRHNLDRARAQLRVLATLTNAGERVAELVRNFAT